MLHKPVFSLLLLSGLFLSALTCRAQPIEVVIGGYQFPPYVIEEQNDIRGAALDIAAALNGVSERFHFIFVPTSIENRYQAFARRRFDIILFEQPDWGWESIEKSVVDLQVADGEVFVGRRGAAEKPGYFDDLSGKTLLLVRGYHYRFVDFETEETKLKRHYLAELVPDSRAALEGLLLGRASIAPISRAFLDWYLSRHPDKAQQLTISNRWDQRYHHSALLHPDSPIKPDEFAALLQTLSESGTLDTILATYQLQLAR